MRDIGNNGSWRRRRNRPVAVAVLLVGCLAWCQNALLAQQDKKDRGVATDRRSERDEQRKKMRDLLREGKLDQAVESARSVLALDRQGQGRDTEIEEDLEVLAELHLRRGD